MQAASNNSQILNNRPEEDNASSVEKFEELAASVSENESLLDLLSIELLFGIFDYLDINEIRKMREVSKGFSHLDLQEYFKHRLYQEFPAWKTFYLEQEDRKFDWYREIQKVYRQEELQNTKYTEQELVIIGRLRSGKAEDFTWLEQETDVNGILTKNFTAQLLMNLFSPRGSSLRLRNWNFPKTTNDFLYRLATNDLDEPENEEKEILRNKLLAFYKIIFNQDIPQIDENFLKWNYTYAGQQYSFTSLAISLGRLDVIQRLYKSHPDKLENQFKVMLKCACECQQLEIIIFLLESAAEKSEQSFEKYLVDVFEFIIQRQLAHTALFRDLFQKYHSQLDLQHLTSLGIKWGMPLSTLKYILPAPTNDNVKWQQDMISFALTYQRDQTALVLLEKKYACPVDVLHQAASNGCVESARALLSGKTSAGEIYVDQQNSEKQTPLLVAISNSQVPMVELLLRAGADLTYSYVETSGKSVTPLSTAFSYRADRVAAKLINIDAPFKAEDFHSAIQAGMLDTAKAMLEKDHSLSNTVTAKGEHVITLILNCLQYKDVREYTILQKQYSDFLGDLLQKLPPETDTMQFKNSIATLLQVAYVYNNKQLAYFAVSRPPLSAYLSKYPLLEAAFLGMHKVVQHLLNQHENYLEERDEHKNNILIYAAYTGDIKLLHMINNYISTHGGIDRIDSKNKFGQSALYIAASNNRENAVKYLLAMGAKLLPNKPSAGAGLNSDARKLLALQSYIQTREAEGEYRAPRRVLIKLFGARASKEVFTKQQKMEAALFFKGLLFAADKQAYCNAYVDKLDTFQAILSEGRLAKIVKALGGCELAQYKPAIPPPIGAN